MDDAKHMLGLISMTDTEKTATFPLNESSSVSEFTGGSKGNSEIFFKVESFITPGVVYRCDLSKGNFDCEVNNYCFTSFTRTSFMIWMPKITFHICSYVFRSTVKQMPL